MNNKEWLTMMHQKGGPVTHIEIHYAPTAEWNDCTLVITSREVGSLTEPVLHFIQNLQDQNDHHPQTQ